MRAIQTPPSGLNLYVASAPADDDEAIMLICALIPSPAYLCATVEHAASAKDSDDGTETVHFLRRVGQEIRVFWVRDVTSEQAVAITAACKRISRWSVDAFTTAVSGALGARVTRVQ